MTKKQIKQENIKKKIDRDNFIEDDDCKIFDYIMQHSREIEENEYCSEAIISFI